MRIILGVKVKNHSVTGKLSSHLTLYSKCNYIYSSLFNGYKIIHYVTIDETNMVFWISNLCYSKPTTYLYCPTSNEWSWIKKFHFFHLILASFYFWYSRLSEIKSISHALLNVKMQWGNTPSNWLAFCDIKRNWIAATS